MIDNNVSDEKITQIAENILESSNTRQGSKSGNLYVDQYSYAFQAPNTLTIVDNTSAKAKLESLLKTSILIFVLIEIIIIILTVEITRWIIKPVIESFNKQKQFVADASHELKTPIAVIMSNAEALEKEPEENKWLNNIKSEADGEINIVLKKQKNDVLMTVSNKGKEIPKEIHEKIFERFYRADESRNRDTNRYGLGLAIAKKYSRKSQWKNIGRIGKRNNNI